MTFDNFLTDGESEAHTFSLRVKNGSPSRSSLSAGMPAPILYGDQYFFFQAVGFDADEALFHGLDGILRDVDRDLYALVPVPDDLNRLLGQVHFQIDPFISASCPITLPT